MNPRFKRFQRWSSAVALLATLLAAKPAAVSDKPEIGVPSPTRNAEQISRISNDLLLVLAMFFIAASGKVQGFKNRSR